MERLVKAGLFFLPDLNVQSYLKELQVGLFSFVIV